MKKWKLSLLVLFSLAFMAGCGKPAETVNTIPEYISSAIGCGNMDGKKVIFRDPEHSFASDIPDEVLNFNAEVLEVRDGSLLVSFISAPELFMSPVTGQCVVKTNPEIMKEDVIVGDTVRVWFDSLVQEIYPPILPNVYRIVKE